MRGTMGVDRVPASICRCSSELEGELSGAETDAAFG